MYAVALSIEDFPKTNILIGSKLYTPNDPISIVPLQASRMEILREYDFYNHFIFLLESYKQNNRIIKTVYFSLKKRGFKNWILTYKVSLQFLINTVNLDASSGAPPVFVNDTPPAGSALEVKLPQTISILFYAYSNQT